MPEKVEQKIQSIDVRLFKGCVEVNNTAYLDVEDAIKHVDLKANPKITVHADVFASYETSITLIDYLEKEVGLQRVNFKVFESDGTLVCDQRK